MRSEDIGDIRTTIDDNDARDMKRFVWERSFWRKNAFPMIVVATIINLYLAGRYLVSISPSHPGDTMIPILQMTLDQAMNWGIAAIFIVAGRVLMVLRFDATLHVDEDQPKKLWENWFLDLCMAGCIAFSIFTAAMGVSVGVQERMDRSAQMTVAAQDARQDTAAQRSIANAAASDLSRAIQARDDANDRWKSYQDRAALQDRDGEGWMLRPSAIAPYLAAIREAELGVDRARSSAQRASGSVSMAANNQERIIDQGDAHKTQLAIVGSYLPERFGGPLTAAQTAMAFGFFCAIFLEIICYATQAGSARSLRAMTVGQAQTINRERNRVQNEAAATITGQGGAPSIAGDGLSQGNVVSMADSNDPMLQAARMRHSDRIANALADARAGSLTSASFSTLRKYGGGDEAGKLIRAELVSEGLAMAMPNGQIEMLRAAS